MPRCREAGKTADSVVTHDWRQVLGYELVRDAAAGDTAHQIARGWAEAAASFRHGGV